MALNHKEEIMTEDLIMNLILLVYMLGVLIVGYEASRKLYDQKAEWWMCILALIAVFTWPLINLIILVKRWKNQSTRCTHDTHKS